jgi:ribosomal protein L11 methyltransferase
VAREEAVKRHAVKEEQERAPWLEVTVVAPEGLAAELASQALMDAGASGIEERAPLDDGRAVLVAWLPGERAPLDALPLARLGAAVRSARAVKDRDWEEAFWSGLAPLDLGRRLVVVPTRGAPAKLTEGRVAIKLDPGAAFGTGLHPTTALVAAMLEESLAARISAGSVPVLDVGTGSGILAIAAWLLGARPVLAIDNDPDAVAEAWKNARQNGCRDAFEASDRPLEEIDAHFAVVVANLDAPTLAVVGERLASRVAPGGELLVSGLRESENFAPPPGLEKVETRAAGGWRAERWRSSTRSP